VLLVAAALFLPAASASRAERADAVRVGGISGQPSMRPWRFGGPNPDGWWCREACRDVANGTVFVDRELALIAHLGVRLLRLEFPWPLLEPRRGTFDWRRADYIVRRARRHRVRVQPVLVYSPGWAAPTATRPPTARDFSRFARKFATRYRRSIDHYELWNEPDTNRYWDGTQAAYVENVLRPGYRAVKAGDPSAKVLLGGPATPNLDWLTGIYRLGGGRSFDVLAYHDYTADPEALIGHAFAVKGVLNAHGQSRKPVWLGEYGVQEADRSSHLQKGLIRAALTAEAPLAVAQWYTLRDDFPMTCCPPRKVKSEYYGLLTHAYVEKEGYQTMRQLLVRRAPR
jgi:hypothetical protein